MRRRVLSLVIGLLIAGAPEALAPCHSACAASRSDASAHGHQGHSHPSTNSAAKTFKAVPHVCGRADELSTTAVPVVRISASPAVPATIFTTVPPVQGGERISCGLLQTPPGNTLLTIPLRV
jgi:hypothetical protein